MRCNFKQYERLCCQWAHHYAKVCPKADLEDLLAESRVAYVLALGSWNPSKGKFSTHLVWKLRGRLTGWIRKEIRRDQIQTISETGEGESLLDLLPSPRPFLEELFEQIGEDAKQVVRDLLSGKGARLNGSPTRRKSCLEIREALRSL